MTSANSITYLSEFFLRTLGLYLALKDRITNVNLIKFDYHVAGKQYKSFKVDFFMSKDSDLTDKEAARIGHWDNRLDIYLSYKAYNYNSPKFELSHLELNNAEAEISNLINLFENVCENVSLDKDDELHDRKDIINIETLAMMCRAKDYDFFKTF